MQRSAFVRLKKSNGSSTRLAWLSPINLFRRASRGFTRHPSDLFLTPSHRQQREAAAGLVSSYFWHGTPFLYPKSAVIFLLDVSFLNLCVHFKTKRTHSFNAHHFLSMTVQTESKSKPVFVIRSCCCPSRCICVLYSDVLLSAKRLYRLKTFWEDDSPAEAYKPPASDQARVAHSGNRTWARSRHFVCCRQ